MAELEKVVNGLQHCYNAKCEGCTYGDTASGHYVCRRHEMLGDALELLKEREPVKPIDETYWNHTYGRCGHCKAPLPVLEGLHSKFCWMCGKTVKWDDED